MISVHLHSVLHVLFLFFHFLPSSSCQPVILLLLDITPMLPVLEGVVMELQDCALPLLKGNYLRVGQWTLSQFCCCFFFVEAIWS